MIYELPGRVVEITITPDSPGWVRRTCKIEVLSGVPLSEEDLGRFVAELVGAGNDVIGWEFE